uniref:C2H2-type domain-containing protein n=1 Tax=Ornithorhynchus anatinus TaxID=9258 RepID=A0A6I8P212_ORNAN
PPTPAQFTHGGRGGKPHACPVCPRRFRDAGELAHHQRVHTGERPFQCRVCHMRFGERNTLQRHARRSTGPGSPDGARPRGTLGRGPTPAPSLRRASLGALPSPPQPRSPAQSRARTRRADLDRARRPRSPRGAPGRARTSG